MVGTQVLHIYLEFFEDTLELFSPFLFDGGRGWLFSSGLILFLLLIWIAKNKDLLLLVLDRLFLRMNIAMAFVFSLLTVLFLIGVISATDRVLEGAYDIYYTYSSHVEKFINHRKGKKKEPKPKEEVKPKEEAKPKEEPKQEPTLQRSGGDGSSSDSPDPKTPENQASKKGCCGVTCCVPSAPEKQGDQASLKDCGNGSSSASSDTKTPEDQASKRGCCGVTCCVPPTPEKQGDQASQKDCGDDSRNAPSDTKTPENQASKKGCCGVTCCVVPPDSKTREDQASQKDCGGVPGNAPDSPKSPPNAGGSEGKTSPTTDGEGEKTGKPTPSKAPTSAGNPSDSAPANSSAPAPSPKGNAPAPPQKVAKKKWNLDLVGHFLYIITPSSSIPNDRDPSLKFIIQLTVVYLGYLVLAGLVVSFLLYLLRNKLQDIERGEKRNYRYLSDHIVIIGSRDYLWKLIEHIENNQEKQPISERIPKSLRDPWKICRDRLKGIWERILDNEGLSLFVKSRSILILTSRPAKDVRDELDMHLPRNLVRRTILTHGSCTDGEALRRLNIPNCKAIYVIGETLDESMDSMNLECVRTISRQVLPQRQHPTILSDNKALKEKRIPCHVYFERTATYALLQRGAFEPFRNLVFIPYCFHKNWIEKILCVSEPYMPLKNMAGNGVQQNDDDDEVHYLPLDREPITADSSRYAHLIIIGCSRMGLALATEAAHILHFPNFVTKGIKSRITLIGSQVDERIQTLQNDVKPYFEHVEWEYIDLSSLYDKKAQEENANNRTIFYPEKDCIDQKWTFIKGNAHSPRLQHIMREFADDPNALVTVAVCIANDRDASRIALNLPREFYKPGQEVPILVRQEAGAGLMHALHYTKTHNYAKVLPFGMRLDEFDLVQKDSDQSAMISWLVYRNTQRLHQEKRARKEFTTYRERAKVEKSIDEFLEVGKNENMKWNDLSMRLKFANRYRSYLLWSYLRSLGKTNFKCKTQVELDGDMRHLRDTLMFHGKMMAEVEHNRWNVEQLLLGKLPRPTLNTEENDDINDIVPYKELKAINQWCRINLTLFLYLPVKYYLEAKMLRQQKEEAEKEKNERRNYTVP